VKLRRIIAIPTTLAIVAALTLPALAAPPAAVLAPINQVIASINAGNTSRLNGYYVSNPILIDEYAPYTWTGSNAAVQWWSGFEQLGKKVGFTNVKASMQQVQHYDVIGDKAYVVAPVVITYMAKGKPQKETGLWAFTLQRAGGTWKIATQSWATATNTM
jgi:hypothetical protein